ncbi:MAG: T9SS type A sorting domain-containing protein [Bacteroidales bacterium]|nr:T9SS type A sorting domain-containing protein [Bacteroidales bacterium]
MVELDVSPLASGIYLLTVETSSGKTTRKMVVSR